jgi:membrane protein YdbS with pleckstrin-like domain
MAMEPQAEPAHRLSPAARWLWRAQWAGASLAALLIGRSLGDELGDAGRLLLVALPAAALLLGTPVVPELRWRGWRWEVREEEIDLRRGVLTVRRTLIPMPRVQHVETASGVLERALGLATVQIHTAAGSHTIPLLAAGEARRLRTRIAALARTGDA